MDTRREFIKKAALLSLAAGSAYLVPASIRRALEINPDAESTFLDAEHVVILMQENRSFDHCFGALRGVRGFNDPRAIQLGNKNHVWFQSDKAGNTFAPFHFDINDSKITWMGSIPHTRASQVDADNLSRYDQWIDSKRSGNKKYADIPLTMGFYDRGDLPFNYAMADAFTICDQHFSSVMSSTWPNRLFMWGGTIRAEKSGDAKAYVRNDIPWGEAHWKVFPERLQEHNISWKVYQNDITTQAGFTGEERAWLSNFGCNQLEFLSQYNVKFSKKYTDGLPDRAAKLRAEIKDLETRQESLSPGDSQLEKIQKDVATKKRVLKETMDEVQEWSSENFQKLSDYQKQLFYRAFTSNDGDPDFHSLEKLQYEADGEDRELMVPKGDVLYQFRKDVDSGQLPTVSWLVPSQNLSDHPSAPWYGAWFTSEILDILTKNPEVWKKTIFILTYDENDGYFDHVPPFVAPDPENPLTGKCSPGVNESGVEYIRLEQELKEGINKKAARGGPVGLGFRVPMIIASPWSRGGKVCSQVFDHTSTLQFLEEFLNGKFGKNIREENISEWRRTVCGNLTSAFTRYDGKEREKLSFFLSRDPFVEKIFNARFKEEPKGFRNLSKEDLLRLNKDGLTSMGLQESGTKVSRPLPYELYADGKLSDDKKDFVITMNAGNGTFGKVSAGAAFIVYAADDYVTPDTEASAAKTYEPLRAWHFAVKAGGTLTAKWPLEFFRNGGYHLRVHGPNGFFREFRNDGQGFPVNMELQYERKTPGKSPLTGNVELAISNSSNRGISVTVLDNAYGKKQMVKRIKAGGFERIVIDLKDSRHWYDFTVLENGVPGMSKRFAGRVETGEEGISDPAMG